MRLSEPVEATLHEVHHDGVERADVDVVVLVKDRGALHEVDQLPDGDEHTLVDLEVELFDMRLRRHGRGAITYAGGAGAYEGELAQGERHGEGVLTGADGRVTYRGSWVADQVLTTDY